MTTGTTEARGWANKLLHDESRGPGDMENAMHRLEHRYGIPWRVFWSLRYRPPADVLHGIYERLRGAYLSECERQEQLLHHEIEVAKLLGKASSPAVRAAEALVDEVVND